MDYLIKRGDAQYGPYSLAGLQQYLQSGHLSKDDLARSEGMADWVPLWQVLGSVPVPPQAAPAYPAAGGYAAYGAAPAAAQYPAAGQYAAAGQYPMASQPGLVDLPPNMPWWGLLIAAFVPGVSILITVWIFILAAWAKKLSGKSTALVCFGSLIALMIVGFIVIVAIAASVGNKDDATNVMVGLLVFGIAIGAFVLAVVGHFAIRSAMEDYYNRVENIGLKLSGAMVFFFNVFYFQYHVNQIYERKRGYMPTPYPR